MKRLAIILIALLFCTASEAQLKPGFDANEYLELLRLSRQQADTALKKDKTPLPLNYTRIYRSPVGPLQNRWDLWVNKTQDIAAISIRGTTSSATSWLENFYAAMVPAQGKLHISDTTDFKYHLADNPRAAVHIGWLLGMADLSKTIVPQIQQLYRTKHIKSFIIVGHSQGAAIAYLLRSHLDYLQRTKVIAADITFKTYCSAPPKPGNLYYAYDYEFLTRNGWGIAITNAYDWVPQTPLSVQTINDFNTLNPFSNINEALAKQSFFIRLYLKHVYNRIRKPGMRAQENSEKYLGHTIYKYIKKQLPQFAEPEYATTNDYVRCGTPVILMPDDAYNQLFKNDPKNVFVHHLFYAYYWLTQHNYLQNAETGVTKDSAASSKQ
ncbi:lipase family protein [Mucilaginibacter sp. RS28]|uniref:Lipase family protein n=1 Tax=Mucilaginibacter straminoryzae TaxID=2932774 RepID=A0A9X1X1U2_9SPHI|nr:lipase family protein [Mucilaginibacter straminoryzae]MCJ8208790.1 lipase family protein [Mucilaginibacter straminoryzae]